MDTWLLYICRRANESTWTLAFAVLVVPCDLRGEGFAQGVSSLSPDSSSRTEEERILNPLFDKGTHGAPAVTDCSNKEEVFVEMDESIVQEEHNKADKMDTTIRLPESWQYMDAEVFVAEQIQLRKENSKDNDGRKTLMVSHW